MPFGPPACQRPVSVHTQQDDEADLRRPFLAAGVLVPAVQEGEGFTFTMCNPPFFESMEEAGQNPATAFSGTAVEMVCPGGELAFVTRMVADSLQLKVCPDKPALLHCLQPLQTACAGASSGLYGIPRMGVNSASVQPGEG